MTLVNYKAMTLKELRRYIITHREEGALHFINAPYKISDRTNVLRRFHGRFIDLNIFL
jgi:hypothetical protein